MRIPWVGNVATRSVEKRRQQAMHAAVNFNSACVRTDSSSVPHQLSHAHPQSCRYHQPRHRIYPVGHPVAQSTGTMREHARQAGSNKVLLCTRHGRGGGLGSSAPVHASANCSSVVVVEIMPLATPRARNSCVRVSAASFLPEPRFPEIRTLRTHAGSASAARARQSRRSDAQYSLRGCRPMSCSSAISTRASLAGSEPLQCRAIWRYSTLCRRVFMSASSRRIRS